MLVVKVEESYAFCLQILHVDQLDNDILSKKKEDNKIENHQLTAELHPHGSPHFFLFN